MTLFYCHHTRSALKIQLNFCNFKENQAGIFKNFHTGFMK